MGRARILILMVVTVAVIFEYFVLYSPTPPPRPAPPPQAAPAAAPGSEPPPIQVIPITPDSR